MKYLAAAIAAVAVIFFALRAVADGENGPVLREKAQKTMKDGNFKDAYELFSKLALDPNDDARKVSQDLGDAITCLQRLNRINEVDDLREKVIAAHGENWRLLQSAAETIARDQHHGFIVAGKFQRGNHRGGGNFVYAMERDRVRSLQVMTQAMEKAQKETDKNALSIFHSQFANLLMQYGSRQAWQLQTLTDISKLPDYEEGYNYYNNGQRGAPVEPDGTPIYYKLPKSYADAKNDGERWRWLLMQAVELSAGRAAEIRMQFANFLQQQFDVRTMASYGRFFGGGNEGEGEGENESGPYAMRTLGEDETIARLATGIKRFKLPDEFNYIKMYQEIANTQKASGYAENALNTLAQIFEDRQQYPKAAEYWRRSIKEFGDQPNGIGKQKRVEQIVGNWGIFEGATTQPAGQGASVEYRFRNGSKVSFQAFPVDTKKLLDDVKAYLKSNPAQMNWEQMDISNLGYRLVEKNQNQYLGPQTAAWELELKPRAEHFDRRTTVSTPLQKAGAYLVTAQMQDGNVSRVVLWIADTTIVKKALDKTTLCYVADAASGQPIANAKLDFFGYQNRWENNRSQITTAEFSANTDGDGQVLVGPERLTNNHSWIISASSQDGRAAYLGFTNIWSGNIYDHEYNQRKVFGITDRPVYRPKQPVKFKIWLGHAKYDQEGLSVYAHKALGVQINNPKGEKIFEKSYTTDGYGGLDGELTLDKDATLGMYSIQLSYPEQWGVNWQQAVAFRLEEYKKPEFEVKVDAPGEPVMLGEKIAAKINAKYYFGAPVTEAKVKYKIMRHNHSANWYPAGVWDWFYQPGYWWFACDYAWYPGWGEWGCKRPYMSWWGNNWSQPELVCENETQIGADGTLNVEIDTAVAKALHGNTDHKYEITAEVTDASRRTIVGSGTVLVARKPFKVYAWVDRGHYRVGDSVEASFSAQTLDNKPVKGPGALKLLKVAYDKDNKPVETAVQEWPLDTNEEGKARIQIKATQAGQYRLSYKVTDDKKHAIEGGYVFCVVGEGFDGSQFRFNDVELVTDKRELPDLLGRFGVTDAPTGISTFGRRHRAYVKVQDGCMLR